MSDDDIAGPRGFGNNQGNRKQRRAKSADNRRSHSNRDGLVPSMVQPTGVMADMHCLAADTDVISNADALWFRNNPARRFRLRLVDDLEIAFDKSIKPADALNRAGYALVKKIAAEHRLRLFFLSKPFRTPEAYDDVGCEILFEALGAVSPQIKQIAEQVGRLVGGAQT